MGGVHGGGKGGCVARTVVAVLLEEVPLGDVEPARRLVVRGPGARVQHGPARGVECQADVGVAVLVGVQVGVAAVQLERVDGPVGERLRVERGVAQGARVAAAREGAPVAVDAELEAFAVDVVCEGAHAGGEALAVGDDLVGGEVAQLLRPAVVDVDVLVAHGRVAVGRHAVGHCLVEGLGDAVQRVRVAVDVAAVALPREPAHGRSEGQAVVERVGGGGQQSEEDEGEEEAGEHLARSREEQRCRSVNRCAWKALPNASQRTRV